MINDNNISMINNAANIIKDAIILSRYQAAKLINKELLSLYYGVGKFVSDNSREGYWGKGAIKHLSKALQKELPGLRGFSESSIKRMRDFYEQWFVVFTNRPLVIGDLYENGKNANRPSAMGDLKDKDNNDIIDLTMLSEQMSNCNVNGFFPQAFLNVGYTHHTEILAKEKSLEGRLFYIYKCAEMFWTVETLKSKLRGDLYNKSGKLPNNFALTIQESKQAKRATKVFKDEYFLDYINIEDDDDPEERVLQQEIVDNIKKFVLSFGDYFVPVGSRYRVIVDEEEFYTDLLFFNRELRCLVAIELKRGKFRPAYLGQLQFYLSALDEYVKLPWEEPSIGILLCKEAKRSIVEIAVRDYKKPMGVATYRTRNEMPEQWQKALPDIDDMRKILENSSEETVIVDE